MSLFDSFITNLKAKVDAQTAYKQSVIQVVKEVVGVPISPEQIISLKEGVLRLAVPSTLKSALLLKQRKLLAEFSKHSLMVTTIQ